MDNFEQQVYAIKEAQQKKLVSDLEARKQEGIQDIAQKEKQLGTETTAQKLEKNIASQQQKLNFAEFMANRGQTSSGLSAMGELSRQNVLARDVGNIESSYARGMETYGQGRQALQRDYNVGLTSGTAQIEADTSQKLLAYTEQLRQEALKQRLEQEAWDRQVAEQQRQEQAQVQERIRQEQIAQATARSSGGGGGGGNIAYEPTFGAPTNQVNTEYYSGPLNKDAQYGVFNNNSHQPDNIGGSKLVQISTINNKKATYTNKTQTLSGQAKTVSQNVWYNPSTKQAYYWEGRENRYIPISSSSGAKVVLSNGKTVTLK